MNVAVESDVEWIILKNDLLRGYDPEQLTAGLMVMPSQHHGTWCDGHLVLKELHEQELLLVGAATKPEFFPPEWQQYQIAVFGTRYFEKGDVRKVPHIRVYTFKDGEWHTRMKSFETDFNIKLARLNNMKIPVYRVQ